MQPAAAWLVLIAAASAIAPARSSPEEAGAGDAASRRHLRAQDLLARSATGAWLPLDAFAPSEGARPAQQRFEGRLTLHGPAQAGGFRLHVDAHAVAAGADSSHRHLPQFAFEFLQVGEALVPVVRGAIAGDHPYWEFILGTGRVWEEPGDGGYSRAALPFSLQEVNANCTHNGVLSFLYRTDGRVSRVAYQVSSETCVYFKVDLWGVLDASYAPHAVADRAALVQAHRRERASRLPRKPIADLARDYPGIDPDNFGHRDDVSPAHMTTWGVVVDGVHYAGGCPTRAGPYPFCEELHLPSYSLAKSMFAGLALMRLERLHPGTRHRIVAEYVPECVAGGNWSDVTFENLLDMASGNYLSADDYGDENATHGESLFFARQTHREKIDYACNFFPRKAAPGERWVYHTSDTYLLGAAMDAFLERTTRGPADLLDDLLVPDVWRPIGLGPATAVSRRTRDPVAQPFAGFGLTLQSDDVAKLLRFLDPANPRAEQLLDRDMYRAALQRDAQDRGLAASDDGALRYNNGFWGLRVAGLPGCEAEQYVPFMSGFGGISVVSLPDGVGYYYFSDNGEFRFRRTLDEAARIRGGCQPRLK